MLSTAAAEPRLYGSALRSCETCARAKAKCVRKGEKEVCDRCARLGKECATKELVVRKRKPVKLTRTAQLENLENKLENLVHALSAQHQQQQSEISPPDSQSSNGRRLSSADRGPSPIEHGPSQIDEAIKAACDDEATAPSLSATYGGSQIAPNVIITAKEHRTTGFSNADSSHPTVSMQDTEALFDRYQRLLAPNNPFVVFPPETSAWELANTRPFLMQAVNAVTMFHDLPASHQMYKNLVRQLAERMLINGEKSMELLQGILVLLHWFHPHLHENSQTSNLLHLAMSMVCDLNIDRAPGACREIAKEVNGPHATKNPRPASSEERRALLGTFYLGSMLFTSFHKLEPLRFTAWMSESLHVLERNAEYESDIFLVQLVRAQHLQEEINASSVSEVPPVNIHPAHEASSATCSSVPLSMRTNAFSSQLNKISIPPVVCRLQYLLQLQVAGCRIAIYDRSFQDLLDNKALHHELWRRLPNIWKCVDAIRAYAEIYFSTPIHDNLTLPFSAFAQFGFAFITLLRLATMEVTGWDQKILREHLDFAEMMEKCSKRFEAVEAEELDGMAIKNDAFARFAVKTRWLKQFYESKANPDVARTLPPPPAGLEEKGVNFEVAPQQPTPPHDLPVLPETFTYFDEAFWNSFNDFDFPMEL